MSLTDEQAGLLAELVEVGGAGMMRPTTGLGGLVRSLVDAGLLVELRSSLAETTQWPPPYYGYSTLSITRAGRDALDAHRFAPCPDCRGTGGKHFLDCLIWGRTEDPTNNRKEVVHGR